MKTVACLVIFLISLGSLAQTRVDNGAKFSNEELAILSAKNMAMQLDLSKEQESKLKELYFKRIEEKERLSKEVKKDSSALIEQRQELMEKHKAELKRIFTPDQFAKWEELQEKIRKSNTKDSKIN